MKTTRRKSRILDEVQETARGLHDAGLISQARMEAFDALHREAEDAARLRALRAAVDVGIADIEAGRFKTSDSAESLRAHSMAIVATVQLQPSPPRKPENNLPLRKNRTKFPS